MSDAALMRAAMAGDQSAILDLLGASQADLRRLARRSCRNSSDVEDAVQETLWIVYRRIGALRSLGAYSAWLFRIVTRACLRLARRAGVVVEATDTDIAERPPAELRIDLARGVQSLPDHYRQVLLLRDVQELTIDEIGARLALSRESVKGRLHRARAMMREYLQD